jgi:hypothetical protein
MFMMSKVKLLQEKYKDKKFDEMTKVAKALSPMLASLKFNDDKDKDGEIREYFKKNLGDMELYGLYGEAQAFFDKKEYAKVAELLKDLIDDANKKSPNHPVIKNAQLGNILLSMQLRSNIQLAKLDKARQVIPLLQAVAKESGDAGGPTTVLKQLVAIMKTQLDEMDKKKDEAQLNRMKTGFTALIDELTKQETKPTPEFVLLLAQAYATMGENKKAGDLLEKVPEPKADDAQGKKVYQTIRLLYVRQLRLSGELEKAKPLLLDVIIGKDRKGWGARNIDALKEEVLLLEADRNFAVAALKADKLVKELIKKVEKDNSLKEQYFECYYHVAYCFLKHGQNQVNPMQRAKFIEKAANQIEALEKRWKDRGGLGDVANKRFQDLLNNEPELKAVYDSIKGAAAPSAGK